MKFEIKFNIYIFLLFLLCAGNISAQQVSKAEALSIAMMFHKMLSGENEDISRANIDYSVYPIGGKSPTMYKICFSKGWIIVSADKRTRPVLAYSNNNESTLYDSTSINEQNALISWYDAQILNIRDQSKNEVISSEWNQLNSYRAFSRSYEVVSPLLQRDNHIISWRQSLNQNLGSADCDKTYNKFFHIGNNGDSHCHKYVVGCGNLSAGEIMWYWQWPKSAMVKDTMNKYVYREYDWDSMPYVLSNSTSQYSADMVATLLRDISIADSTEFESTGTSTTMYNVLNALKTCFGYEGEIVIRDNYSNSAWLNSLKTELDNGRPILYAGCVTFYRQFQDPIYLFNESHQFVIDGYTSDDYFHVIYSQNSHSDGYYTLDLSNSTSNVYYNGAHMAIVGLKPMIECSPVVINNEELWYEWFNKSFADGVTIINKEFSADSKGIISSGNFVRLNPGVAIRQGATIRIGINEDISCSTSRRMNRRYMKHQVASSGTKGHDQNDVGNCCSNLTFDIVNNIFRIYTLEQVFSIRLYSLSGQPVLQTTKTEIDVSALPQGMYIVRAITVDGEQLQAKFIKQ